MAITTDEKRRRLEDAWDATTNASSLRDTLRVLESNAGRQIAGGSLSSVAANGRHSAFAAQGPGQLTPVEVAQIYRQLIDLFDQSKKWLLFCAARGLDPFNAELVGNAQSAAATVNPAIVIDNTGKFAELCAIYDIGTGVIGSVVGDEVTFMWMMDHLYPVTESRSDYSGLRTNCGAGWV